MDAPIFIAILAVIGALGVCYIALAVVEDIKETPNTYTYRGPR